eukprot:jgi/Ulvmu1/3030/UM015_0070.1
MATYQGKFDIDAELRTVRAICHVDLDAFYAQVEEKAHPQLRGLSIAVIQYNPFGDLKTYREDEDRVFNDSNGSIIALSYGEARNLGVKRNMRGTEARQLCPSLQLVQVPTSNGKADLTSYRRNGAAVLAILSEPDGECEVICEKASIDESYLDVTDAARERLRKQQRAWAQALPAGLDQVHVGCQSGDGLDPGVPLTAEDWYSRPVSAWSAADALLAHASQIVAEKRAKVHATLGFTLSAGVAHSKLLAKLCSGLNKPNQQTVLPASSVAELLHDLPLSKLRGLGGQLGDKVQRYLSITTIGELSHVPMQRLHATFGEDTGRWLHDMCRGVDRDPVQPRLAPKSVGCGKSFTAHLQIKTLSTAQHWLQNLAQEIHERLEEDAEEHGRRATRLVLHMSSPTGHKSKGAPLPSHSAGTVARVACQLMSARAAGEPSTFPLTGLSLVASAFDSSAAKTASLRTLFGVCARGTPVAQAPLPDSGAQACVPMLNASLEERPADLGVATGSTRVCMPSDMQRPRSPEVCQDVLVPNDAVSAGAPGCRVDAANTGQHSDDTPNSGHMSPAVALLCGGKEDSVGACTQIVGPSADPQQHLPDPSRTASACHGVLGTECSAVAVDALTLAQMPSEIRSELYLMAKKSTDRGTHPPQKKRTRSPRHVAERSQIRRTHGIANFFRTNDNKSS